MRLAGSHLLLSLVAAGPIASTAQAECPLPVAATVLAGSVGEAEAAFTQLDRALFATSTAAVERDLPCVDAVISPVLAGRIHRLSGLQAFLDRDFDAVALSLAAYRHAAGDDAGLSDLLPDGHPLHADLVVVDLASARYDPVQQPGVGRILLDGVESARRPADWATIYQRLDDQDALQLTLLLPPSVSLPALPVPTLVEPPHRSRTSRTLLYAGLGVGAIAGGMLATNRACYAAWQDAGGDDYRSGSAGCARATYIGTALSGVASAGLGLGAVLVGRW